MDNQSSGAILRILNLIARADGQVSPEEEHLLESLINRHKITEKIADWEDDAEQPTNIKALAMRIDKPYHTLTCKAATMIADISRVKGNDDFICPEEYLLLDALYDALEMTSTQISEIQHEAKQDLEQSPTLWQIIYSCFGSQYEPPIFV